MSLFYDPLGRLAEYDTTVSARFVYDGAQMIQQVVNPSGATTRRYVWGAAPDELLAWYEGSGTTDRRYAHADERGSIVGYTDASGTAIIINHYDEYGIPESTNNGQFQYTGQMWLPELGLYNYKARMYSATLGRFLQTDPIGYGDGTNWYNYVGSNPVNFTDPWGLACSYLVDADGTTEFERMHGDCGNNSGFGSGGGLSYSYGGGYGGGGTGPGRGGGGSPHPINPTSSPQSVQNTLCQLGNAAVAGSSKLGDASLTTTEAGAGLGVAGIASGQPEIAGLGGAAIATGGLLGTGSGLLQVAGGLAQGFGGGGFHNAIAGAVSLGSGVILSKALQASIPRGLSGAGLAKAQTQNSIVGNLVGALQGLADWFSPTQSSCPK